MTAGLKPKSSMSGLLLILIKCFEGLHKLPGASCCYFSYMWIYAKKTELNGKLGICCSNQDMGADLDGGLSNLRFVSLLGPILNSRCQFKAI